MKAAAAVLLVLVLGGCGLSPPAAQRSTAASPQRSTSAPEGTTTAPNVTATAPPTAGSPRPTPSVAAGAGRTHEVPTPAPGASVAGGWPSPTQAVEAFATAYVNWNYRTVALHLRALAEVSVGQARSMLSMAAAQVGRDSELRRGQIANRGVVEAIGPVRGHADQYAVVTRERTTAARTSAYQGLSSAWHVAVATVVRVRGLWVLSAWQPES